MRKTKLVVIGMGYVGIPAAALFADVDGFNVVGIQRRSKRSGWKIDYLNEGRSPFPENEPGIADLIHRVVKEKKTFKVTDDFAETRDADCILIDVQTPVEPDTHEPKYESLIEVTERIAGLMKHGAIVCIESTVAPGTTGFVVQPALEKTSNMRAGVDFHLCFSYERVMVGRLLHNIRSYPRIVGGLTDECRKVGVDLYTSIVKAPVIGTDCLTAEVSKTVENAYRDVNIAFANEVALMCESLGVNVYEVRELVNNLPNDPSNPAANPVRNMHIPGAGVGGHCLPKDSWLLKYGVDTYGQNRVDSKVIIGARNVNDEMPRHVVDLAINASKQCNIDFKKMKVTVLGYAFLEDSDDTRNTPSESIIRYLRKKGISDIIVHDPYVREQELPDVKRDLADALRESDCAIIATAHSEYKNIDLQRIRKAMRTAILIDGRNLMDGKHARDMGFHYRAVGKQ